MLKCNSCSTKFLDNQNDLDLFHCSSCNNIFTREYIQSDNECNNYDLSRDEEIDLWDEDLL